jgi:lipopolysaccharide biosynthesis protein
VILLLSLNDCCVAVESYFGLTSDSMLVIERNGSVVESNYDMIKYLAAEKETLMVLSSGECWTSHVSEVWKL